MIIKREAFLASHFRLFDHHRTVTISDCLPNNRVYGFHGFPVELARHPGVDGPAATSPIRVMILPIGTMTPVLLGRPCGAEIALMYSGPVISINWCRVSSETPMELLDWGDCCNKKESCLLVTSAHTGMTNMKFL